MSSTISTRESAEPTRQSRASSRPEPRQVVGALWLFAILCYLYCDVLASHDPDYVRGVLSGSIGGVEMTPGFLFGAAVLMTIPITGVLLTRVAPRRWARGYSIAAGTVMTLVQTASLFVGSAPTAFYLWFSALEIAATVAIVWVSVTRWSHD